MASKERKRQKTAPEACVVKVRGIELRGACVDCTGVPRSGQFTLADDTPLYAEGDPAEFVFAVTQGFMRESRTLSDGRAQPVRLIRPGDLAGLEALTSPVYQGSVESVTEVVACRVSAAEARAQIASRTDQAFALLGEATAELRAVGESALWVGALTAEERVHALLRWLTENSDKDAFVEMPLTRFEMAEFLGLAHATVSRIIQRFRRRGMIDVRGRWIRVKDRDPSHLARNT